MEKDNKNILILKLMILIILLIILVICSFKTGQKFFILRNTYFDTTMSEANSGVARWYFNAIIIP